MIRLMAAALFSLLALPVCAQDSYYNRGKEKGWFWYEVEPPPPPEPEPVEPPPPPEPIIVMQPPPKPEEMPKEPEAPPALSSAWLKANLESYLHQAMDDPTPENITAYLYLHRLMMDKASLFADNAQVAMAAEPMLSNDVRRPRLEAASSVMSKRASEESSLLLRQIATDGKYVMVVSSRCDTCGPFVSAATTLARQSGSTLDIVTVDNSAPASLGPRMVDVRADPKLVATLNPPAVPTLYLLKRDGSNALITASPIAATDMIRTTIDVAYGKGWVSDVAYQRTRSRNDVRIALPSSDAIPEDAMSDPKKLTEYLRSKMTVGAMP